MKRHGSVLSPERQARGSVIPQVGIKYTPSAALEPLVDDAKTRLRLRSIDVRLSSTKFADLENHSTTNNDKQTSEPIVRSRITNSSIPESYSPPGPHRNLERKPSTSRIDHTRSQADEQHSVMHSKIYSLLESDSLERPQSLSSPDESPSFNVYQFRGRQAGLSDSQLISPHLKLDTRLVNAWLRDVAVCNRSPVIIGQECLAVVGQEYMEASKFLRNELKFVSSIAMDSNIRQAAALITRTARYCLTRHQHLVSIWQAQHQVMAAILVEYSKTAQQLNRATQSGIVEALKHKNESLEIRVKAAETSRDEVKADLQDMFGLTQDLSKSERRRRKTNRNRLKASGVDLRLLELYEDMMSHAENDEWDLLHDQPATSALDQRANSTLQPPKPTSPSVSDSNLLTGGTNLETSRSGSASVSSIPKVWTNAHVLEDMSALTPHDQAAFVALALQQIGEEGVLDVCHNVGNALNLSLARGALGTMDEAHISILAAELPEQVDNNIHSVFLQSMMTSMTVAQQGEFLSETLDAQALGPEEAHKLHSAMYSKLAKVAPLTRRRLTVLSATLVDPDIDAGDNSTVDSDTDSVEASSASALAKSNIQSPKGTSLGYGPSESKSNYEIQVSKESWKPLASHVADTANDIDCKSVQVRFDQEENGNLQRSKSVRGGRGRRKPGGSKAKLNAEPELPTTVDEGGQVWLKVPLPLTKYLLKNGKKKRSLDMSMVSDSVIGEVYMKKIIADRDLRGKGRRHSLAQTVFHFFMQKFGLRRLAEDNIAGLVQAVESYASESRRIKLFGTLVGVLNQNYYTPILGDVVVEIICEVCPAKQVAALFVKGEGKTLVTLTEAVRAIRNTFHVIDRDGIKRGVEIAAAGASSTDTVAPSSTTADEFLAGTNELHRSWPMPQDLRQRLLKRVESMAKAASELETRKEVGTVQLVDLDEFLDVVLEEFLVKLRVDYLMVIDLFGKFDEDENGVLSYDEFTNLINQCQPHPAMQESQIMDLFMAINDVEDDDDDTITKETFAATCVTRCLHLPYWKLDGDGEMASILQSLGIGKAK